jgi:hypothetical protein
MGDGLVEGGRGATERRKRWLREGGGSSRREKR